MAKEYKDLVVGLDIGTSKVMVVVAEILLSGELKLAGLGIAASSGLKRGVVVNIDATVQSIQQALKEILQRYDLKDSKSTIELNEKDGKILLASSDDFKLKAVVDVLQAKLVKRNVPLKGLSFGTITPATGSSVRQEITLQQGIPLEKAREVVKAVKDSKLKVQASIQGDVVRISGKDRDVLQEVMHLLRTSDFGIDMQFTNYRS